MNALMVVDTSAVVSILKAEETSTRIELDLEAGAVLLMPTITLTEVALVALKVGRSSFDASERVRTLGIEIVPVEEPLAISAAEARHRFPIRFGDGFVYALAQTRGLPILTLDAEFRKTDAALVPLG